MYHYKINKTAPVPNRENKPLVLRKTPQLIEIEVPANQPLKIVVKSIKQERPQPQSPLDISGIKKPTRPED